MVEKLIKVSFSNLDKILFSKLKITKAQFIEYVHWDCVYFE